MTKRTLVIDGAAIKGMEQIHGRFFAAFDFSDYYGENLDSLHDCLTEIPYKVVIRITNNSALEESIGERYAKAFRRVLKDSAEENPNITVEFTD